MKQAEAAVAAEGEDVVRQEAQRVPRQARSQSVGGVGVKVRDGARARRSRSSAPWKTFIHNNRLRVHVSILPTIGFAYCLFLTVLYYTLVSSLFWPNDYTVNEIAVGFQSMGGLIAAPPTLMQRVTFVCVFG